MDALFQELRYGLRSLSRPPGFAAVAILVLALGIGANSTVFSVLDGVLLEPLPFPEPERLVQVYESRLDRGWARASFTEANFWDVRELSRSFGELGAFHWESLNLTGSEYPERLRAGRVSASFFETLGVAPMLGRSFRADEGEPGASAAVALLGHGLWTRRFGADPQIVGHPLTLDGTPHVVVGILPAGEPWLDQADVFVPLVRRLDARRNSFEYAVVGRLAPGVSIEAARADLARVCRILAERHPEINAGIGAVIAPSTEWVASPELHRSLWLLQAAVGFLLLVACVNLSSLLLARAAARARETAVRVALGASRGRLARQVLVESSLLSTLGAGAGLALAYGAVRLLRLLGPAGLPRLGTVGLDTRVVAFTLVTAVATSLVTGFVPVLRVPWQSLVAALRGGGRGVAGDRPTGRLLRVLVSVEVALSLVLLVAASLLARSFAEVMAAGRGFRTERRLLFEVNTPESYRETAGGNEDNRATLLMRAFLERVTQMPQVRSAAAVSGRPLLGDSTGLGIVAADDPGEAGEAVPWATWRLVTPGYFRTMGVPLLRGRVFTDADRIRNPWRVVVSRRVAELLWPNRDPVGRHAILWRGQDEEAAEVIGVVGDMRERGLAADPTLAVYIPYYGAARSPIHFVADADGSPAELVPTFRALLSELDPALPISNVQSLDAVVADSVAPRRFAMLLLGAFAAIALALSLAGVYGVLSYGMAQRRNEIGVRLALGASHGHVLRLVVTQGMTPVLAGMAVGAAGALGLSRLLAGLLFGVSPADPATYAVVVGALAAAAATACAIPARRSLRSDPLQALREE